MKKIMVFGTFDIFHKGHKNFLKQVQNLFDEPVFLTAVIARDQNVVVLKKRKPVNSEQVRLKILQKSGLVDRVVLGAKELSKKYEVIAKYCPNIICLGYDQSFFTENLTVELKKNGIDNIKVVRLIAYKPEKYKSSLLQAK